jgi:FkbM family methyltransferase
MSSLQKLPHRLVVGTNAFNQGLTNLSTDLRLLFHGSENSLVLRQKNLDGFQMIVRAEEEVGRTIYYKGVFEDAETLFFRSLISDSSVCFDVGANIGYYSLLFASLNRSGSVHSFEPVPLNYHLLSINALLNGFSNLHANLCAIAEKEGNAELTISTDSAYSSLMHAGRKPVASKIRATLTTIDAYCSNHDISRIDVLKVDVEGAEGNVLSGARQILQDPQRRPRTVMLELYEPMLALFGSSAAEIFRKMEAFGYRPFVASHAGLVPFRWEHLKDFYNVVFVNG